tara:strand:+ start:927 stop:1097 length:171 start_codon:yes stop_codon:yes gene_type:complete
MKKFVVCGYMKVPCSIEVEAETADEAKELAEDSSSTEWELDEWDGRLMDVSSVSEE